jgi:hypothetical protein
MNSPCEAWMRRRQSKRSARVPKGTANSRNGNQWLTTWKPTSAGEWKVSQSTQEVMTCSMLSAIIEAPALIM